MAGFYIWLCIPITAEKYWPENLEIEGFHPFPEKGEKHNAWLTALQYPKPAYSSSPKADFWWGEAQHAEKLPAPPQLWLPAPGSWAGLGAELAQLSWGSGRHLGASTYKHPSQNSADLDGRVCSVPSESCSLLPCLCITMRCRKSRGFSPSAKLPRSHLWLLSCNACP